MTYAKLESEAPARATRSQPRSVGNTLGLLPTIALSTAMAMPGYAQGTGETFDLDAIVVENAGDDGYVATENSNAKATAPIQDTPQTINTITSEEIRDRGLTSVEDVLRTTPGVTLQAGEGGNPLGTAPVIRGFDANADITVDGIRNSSRISYETFNLESVQVTKGGSGSASGRGATGGTINLETKKPLAEDFTDATLTFGTGKLWRGTLDWNRQFESGGVRLNVMRQAAEDLNGRTNLPSDRFGIAPSLTYNLSSTTSLTAGLYYYENHDLPDYGIAFSNANTDPAFSRGSGTEADPYLPTSVDNSTWYGVNNRDFRDNVTASGYVTLDHALGNGLDWSTTLRFTQDTNVYLTTKPNATAAGVEAQTRSGNRQTRTLAFNTQLSGTSGFAGLEHDFAVGLDMTRERTEGGGVTVAGDPNPVLSYQNPNNNIAWSGTVTPGDRELTGETKSVGLYAFDTITFSPQWEMSAGLRYDFFGGYATGTQRGGGTYEYSENQRFLTGNVGVVYHPMENLSLYASYANSAEPALGNAGIQTDSANNDTVNLDPERSNSYEVGAKWLYNDSLLLGAAIFRIQKDNERINIGTGGVDEWVLAGDSRSQGIELTFAGDLTDRLSVSGGYTFINFSSDSDDADYTRNVPEHAFSVWTHYDVNDRWSVGGGATYTGEAKTSDTASIPASWQVDAMVRYNFNDRTFAQLNVTNLLDADVYGSSHFGQFVNVGPARNVSLMLGTRF